MKLTREFIRKNIASIKEEKDKINLEVKLKIDMLYSIISTLSVNIEQTLKYNFPTSQFPPLMATNHSNSFTLIIEKAPSFRSEMNRKYYDYIPLLVTPSYKDCK